MYGKEKTHKYLAVTNVDRSKKDHKSDTYVQNLRTLPALLIDETNVVHLKLVLPFVGKSCPAHSQCLLYRNIWTRNETL